LTLIAPAPAARVDEYLVKPSNARGLLEAIEHPRETRGKP
jgi:hypothetical protein